MAAKKTQQQQETKTTAVATRAAGGAVDAPGSWEDDLARYAQRAAKTASSVSGTGNWITFRAGVMSYRGLPLKDNQLECVVLNEGVHENLFYEDRFDPDNPSSPTCFALAWEKGELKPHETAPNPQAATCAECPQNKFGSSDTGKGKACKNMMRLALIAYGDGSAKQLESCEVAHAKIPVTSVKNWGAYLSSAANKTNKPPFAYVTKMSSRPDPKNQVAVEFEMVKPIDAKQGPIIMRRVREVEGQMIPDNPYEPIEREEAPAPKGRAAPAAKGRAVAPPARGGKAKY